MKENKIVLLYSLFISLLLFNACGNGVSTSSKEETNNLSKDSLELEKSKIELEKQRIEIEKEKISQEKNRMEEKAENNKTIELAQKAQSFYSNPEAIVVAQKTYFYSSPDYMTKRNVYLVKGDIITAQRVSNAFIYVEFYSAYLNKTTTGWIDVNDIEHYNY